ncbi:MAG: hypothetical protein AAF677_13995 [Pseudomonadota bacterium]
MLLACMVLDVAHALGAPRSVLLVSGTLAVLSVALMAPSVGWGRRIFPAVAAALALIALATRADAGTILAAGLASSAFIAAFFTAQAMLRAVASRSDAMAACGRYIAARPPGQRYAALTLGGQGFGIILGYGAISLLGGLAERSAAEEPDPRRARIRLRRMLLAIQRGFISTLPWSPLAFATAIVSQVIPGARWADTVLPCAATGLVLAGTGWVLDTVLKPRLAPAATPAPSVGGAWHRELGPILALLAVTVGGVGGTAWALDIRVMHAVMIAVPVIALGWAALQLGGPGVAHCTVVRGTAARARDYLVRELPGYRGELVLLIMAGFIGALGGRLAAPWMAASGLDLAALPQWGAILLLFWAVPIAGQIGMNPILSVTLLAPLLPSPEAMGLSPTAVVVAITGGWALSGANSPFTATTLLIARQGKVGALHVGHVWNGLYVALAGAVLTGCSFAVAALL